MGNSKFGNVMKATVYLFVTVVSLFWIGQGRANTVIYNDNFITSGRSHSIPWSWNNEQTSPYFMTYQVISGGQLRNYQMDGHTSDNARPAIYDSHLYTGDDVYASSTQGVMDRFVLGMDDMGTWYLFTDGLWIKDSLDFSSTGAPIWFGHYTLNGAKSSGAYIHREWGADNFGLSIEPEQSHSQSGIMILFGIALIGMASLGKKIKRLTATSLSETCGGGRITETIIGTV